MGRRRRRQVRAHRECRRLALLRRSDRRPRRMSCPAIVVCWAARSRVTSSAATKATTACSAAGTMTRSGAAPARTTSTAAAATTVSSMPACPTARLPPSERRRRMTRSTGQVSMVRSICRASTPTRRCGPGKRSIQFQPVLDVFRRRSTADRTPRRPQLYVLGETTGDGVADLMIRVSGSVYLEASDIHILGEDVSFAESANEKAAPGG